MDTYQSDNSDARRHCFRAVEGEPSAHLDPDGYVAWKQSVAMRAVLVAVILFMALPAMVAGISMFDRELLGRSEGLLHWIGVLTRYLEFLPVAATVALTGLVADAREEA
jgi:hypothetical protein